MIFFVLGFLFEDGKNIYYMVENMAFFVFTKITMPKLNN